MGKAGWPVGIGKKAVKLMGFDTQAGEYAVNPRDIIGAAIRFGLVSWGCVPMLTGTVVY